MTFVDTNYFLRFLLRDQEGQFQQVKKLFEEAAMGKQDLITAPLVLFELSWVLSSFYEKDKETVITVLKNLLHMQFIQWEQHPLLIEAVHTFQQHAISLEDAYYLVYAKQRQASSFATFDQKLVRLWKTTTI